ncbi:MAG: MarR family transcriptional regulator [Proteobacteria bacterium]|nr:MarR family transcriptional regulator [Pseudomonadota bacterium]
MIDHIPRQDIDKILFNVMAAIYNFERYKMSKFDLNYEAFYLLYLLRRRSFATMSEIAAEMNIHISTASRAIDRLEKREFVSRKKDPHDKRTTLVCLEPVGERMVRDSEDDSFDIINENLKDLQPEDIEAIVKTAMNMRQVLKLPGKSKA